MAILEEIPEPVAAPAAAAGTEATGEGIEPFLGLSREQCHILLALYHVVDPTLEPNVPVLFPTMAEKFTEDRKERNSLVKKLERSDEVYAQEVLNLQEIQKAVFVALVESDMDTEKAREYLKMRSKDTPLEELTIQEVLSNGFLLGGVRDDSKIPEAERKKKASPVASPNFLAAKAYYDYAFDKFGFTMAAVQLGSFYHHEFKECQGENCQAGEDPEQMSLDYFMKAAVKGNPMAMHKVAWHYDQKGEWHKAIEWYVKAADQGYPDSAHNLGMIYQEGHPKTEPKIEVNLPLALEYYTRGLHYGYGPSGTQMGRLFFMMATDPNLRDRLPSTDRSYSSDPQEYLMTAISFFDKSATLAEWEALQFLGMIYGSKDFGLYDIDRAQNLFELAFITSNGGQQSFEFLVRTLSAKRTIIAEKLQQAEAATSAGVKPQAVDPTTGLKTCAGKDCGKVETKKDEFQRCAGCKKRFFCSRLCQVNDWKSGHKNNCKK
ncbi:uncharacterized protein EMPS_06095 [Entomortierella parvispora]|uniref:MYND-type domain-containing protein n=1 Tax=Entomortierella parvispora TaxID=205924 RepID=A0A9P3HBT6_9FUNG|nr:uncharacterized protein EMPS_06095 [Entomortierella parvispora]